ncbi:MAG: hypothetical protein ACRBN8_13140 [Nannocystales bacterium]
MRSISFPAAMLFVCVGCSDSLVETGDDPTVDRMADPWAILLQQSDDGSQERVIAHELSPEPGEDVVLYGPEPAGALVLCPGPHASVLRGSPDSGYVMDAFFDDGETFGFKPTSLGPNRLTHCPIWSYASGFGVSFTPELPVAWGTVRTLVLDPRGDALRPVPLELPDERAGGSSRIDEHRYVVSARDANGTTLRIIDLDDPEGMATVHRHVSLDRHGYLFEPLGHRLVYITPDEPPEVRAYDVDRAADMYLGTLSPTLELSSATTVRLDDAIVVGEHDGWEPMTNLLVIHELDDNLVTAELDISSLPAQPRRLSTTGAELIYAFETDAQHGYAMVDPLSTEAPRVVAQLGPDEWMLGPSYIGPLGLAGGTVMRDDTAVRLVWFALDGSTPETVPFELDISSCDPDSPTVISSDQETTFWFFCTRDGVQQTAHWSPTTPGELPQWEASVRRIETSEGPLSLHRTLELPNKLIGLDVEDPDSMQLLVDLPSQRVRPLSWDGWTLSAAFFPKLAP